MAGFVELVIWIAVYTILITFGIIGAVLWIRSYDYKVRIRELTGSKVRLVHDTTGKLRKDTENIHFLKLFRKKGIHNVLPLPPAEAVDYDPGKKRKVVECWYSDEIGYVYVKDGADIKGLQPLTTNQRLLMVSQLKKKEQRKKVPWTQYLPFITSGIVLVMVLAIFFIFWGNAVQPIIEIGANYEALLDKTNAILDKATILAGQGQVVSNSPPV